MLNPSNVQVTVASRPHCGRFISIYYPRMSAFDPTNVRKAVSEFTPRHQQKFQNLLPAKGCHRRVAAEDGLRIRAIAELLTQHCLPAGKTAIADVLSRSAGRKHPATPRPPRKRPLSPPSNRKVKPSLDSSQRQPATAHRQSRPPTPRLRSIALARGPAHRPNPQTHPTKQ